MTTANAIIRGALGKLGIVAPGESVKPGDADDCLLALNRLLDAWRVEPLYGYAGATFDDLTTDYDLPAGYERALVYSLAEEVGADFEREIPPTVATHAANARRMIKRANHTVPQLDVPICGDRFNILTGRW